MVTLDVDLGGDLLAAVDKFRVARTEFLEALRAEEEKLQREIDEASARLARVRVAMDVVAGLPDDDACGVSSRAPAPASSGAQTLASARLPAAKSAKAPVKKAPPRPPKALAHDPKGLTACILRALSADTPRDATQIWTAVHAERPRTSQMSIWTRLKTLARERLVVRTGTAGSYRYVLSPGKAP